MSGSELDGPPGWRGQRPRRGPPAAQTPGPAFWAWGVPSVDPPSHPALAWEGLAQETSPLPQASQGAAGSWRHRGWGGRGQARACMLKDPQLPAVSRPWRQNLAFRHQTTVDQAVHPLAMGGGDKVGRSVLARVGLPEKSTGPAGK